MDNASINTKNLVPIRWLCLKCHSSPVKDVLPDPSFCIVYPKTRYELCRGCYTKNKNWKFKCACGKKGRWVAGSNEVYCEGCV